MWKSLKKFPSNECNPWDCHTNHWVEGALPFTLNFFNEVLVIASSKVTSKKIQMFNHVFLFIYVVIFYEPLLPRSWFLYQIRIRIYRVFCLDSTSSIPQVDQHMLDSCSIGCLSKTLQGLCYVAFEFFIFKKLRFKN